MRLATVVWVINPDNKFLILQRALDDYWCPSQWCLPGGRIDKNESILEGAKRELLEETNIVADELVLVYRSPMKDLDVDVSYFLAKKFHFFADSNVLISDEHISYVWVTIQEIKFYDCVPELKDITRRIVSEYI